MSNTEIIEKALKLSPKERFVIIDTLLKSLDRPDSEIEKIWEIEIAKRVKSYKEGKTKTFSIDEVFS